METTALFGGGCFWCTEAVFARLRGVRSVMPGYAGGALDKPTYEQVSEGNTGYAEVVKIVFDPAVITYEQLLDVFFHLHDPTTVNAQGNDVGTQYRSIIFAMDAQQEGQVEAMIKKLNAEKYAGKIVAQVSPPVRFYPAEPYHQDYYTKNSYAPYCQYVIDPKIQKLMTDYKGLVT